MKTDPVGGVAATESRRRLAPGETLPGHQHQHLSVTLVQLRERLHDGLPNFAEGCSRDRSLFAGQAEGDGALAADGSPLGRQDPPSNAIEPSKLPPRRQRLQAPPGHGERLSGGVGRLLRRRSPQGIRENSRSALRVEPLKALLSYQLRFRQHTPMAGSPHPCFT